MTQNGKGLETRFNRMPQWRLDGAVYFVTWRLHSQLDELTPAERSIVADALRHFHEKRYRLAVFVVMNDHVHVVLFPLPGHDLSKILLSLKTFTATRINRLRNVSGIRWQKSSYTEILRNEAALETRMNYVYENPRRRWAIEPSTYQWLEVFN